jgi:hypothetical protein
MISREHFAQRGANVKDEFKEKILIYQQDSNVGTRNPQTQNPKWQTAPKSYLYCE